MQPDTMLALRELVNDLNNEVALYKEFKAVPASQQTNVRNDMYLASETIRLMEKNKACPVHEAGNGCAECLQGQAGQSDEVHSDLGEGGGGAGAGNGHDGGMEADCGDGGREDRQRASDVCAGRRAELVAMGTILAADNFGLPVSTTHVLSSGVAGTMAANKSGLQISTIRNIAAAWVFTLPVAALLSGCLFWLFRQFMH